MSNKIALGNKGFSASTWLLFVTLLLINTKASATDLYLWSENHQSAANLAILKLALERAEPQYGKINLRTTEEVSYAKAFELLHDNVEGFDLVISALDKDREASLLPVYFPLDRGLLGFRLCLISGQSENLFKLVANQTDFAKHSLSVTLSPSWPDKTIMEFNQIPVTSTELHTDRIQLAREDNTVCYSRSLLEIDKEIATAPKLAVEGSFVMIYPQADILYFRKGAEHLAEAIQFGLEAAYQDGSFLEVFDDYYAEIKRRYSLYDRKLFILDSPILSDKGRDAVNRLGLFSFVKQPEN